jgi:hypothetical protein
MCTCLIRARQCGSAVYCRAWCLVRPRPQVQFRHHGAVCTLSATAVLANEREKLTMRVVDCTGIETAWRGRRADVRRSSTAVRWHGGGEQSGRAGGAYNGDE